ncbi:MAG: PFL family protein [Victivallales bacterium]|nr:PFL family protein [Victivallales bacterium]MCF7888925.1 PFL family protein [Victivallales bacterium]
MIRPDHILNTVGMIQKEKLDVRTVTMGINILDCRDTNVKNTCRNIISKIKKYAGNFVETCDSFSEKYAIPVVNKRIAVTPVSFIGSNYSVYDFIELARALDRAAENVGIDIIGGFSANVEKGLTDADKIFIDSIPEALSSTLRVCSSINVGSTRYGINMDAVKTVGEKIKEVSELTADRGGFGAAKFVVFCNQPGDNPFMAGAIHGLGEAEAVINVGVSGPGVIASALKRKINSEESCRLGLHDIAEEIKLTAFRVTRCGELIGRKVADYLKLPFGVVDLSLAPTPEIGDSIGEIIKIMGVDSIGAPGSTAIIAMINDAVKKGGAFASQAVGGLSGAFIPVMEDAELAEAVANQELSLEKLEAMTSVCSVGLDMVAVPGSVDAKTLSSLIADEMAIGMINSKTTAVRVIPVPNKKAGEFVSFGGLFGESVIMPVNNLGKSERFVDFAGRIPAPIHSLKN